MLHVVKFGVTSIGTQSMHLRHQSGRVSDYSSTSHSKYNRSFRRRVFPLQSAALHLNWEPKSYTKM